MKPFSLRSFGSITVLWYRSGLLLLLVFLDGGHPRGVVHGFAPFKTITSSSSGSSSLTAAAASITHHHHQQPTSSSSCRHRHGGCRQHRSSNVIRNKVMKKWYRVNTSLSSTPTREGGGGGGGKGKDDGLSSMNARLIVQNLANQALIGCTIWTGGPGYVALTERAEFSVAAVLTGIAGFLPMLFLSRAIETSESPVVAGLNLSTNMAVLRLFGPWKQPVRALTVSALMSVVTGIVEETTFRGQLLPAISDNVGLLSGAILSTFLFAFLHTNPLAFVQGDRDAKIDNTVLLILQCINGGIFASLFVLTGGNLAVPIVAHALYDFYTFYKTHLVDVAGQMEYAERNALMPACTSRAVQDKWTNDRGERFVAGAKQSFYLMDTDRDGVLSRKELRVALFSYGINLSQLQSDRVARAADADGSGRIDLDEFLNFVGPTGSTGRAVRNTLFGPI